MQRAFVGIGRLQLLPAPARFREHPRADRNDQARLLGEGDEVQGHHETPGGMVPADQGLEPLDLPARQMDHRLEVEDELLVVDGPLQVRLQLQPPERRVVHLRFEDLIPVLPRFLRDVHRDVRVPEELLRSLRSDRPVRTRARDPDARSDEDLLPVELERRVQRLEDPVGDVGRTDALATVLEQDRELVATEAGRRVRRAEARPEPLPDLAQQAVAGRMAQRIVDRLEVVEVHEQDRHRQVVARQALQRVLDAVAEQRAVGEPGDRVVEGLVRELLLEGFALRDVPGVEDDPLHVGIVHQVGAERLDVEPEVVSMPHPRLDERRGRTPPSRLVAVRNWRTCVLSSGWIRPVSLVPSSSPGS